MVAWRIDLEFQLDLFQRLIIPLLSCDIIENDTCDQTVFVNMFALIFL